MSDDFMLELTRLISTGLFADALLRPATPDAQSKRPRSLHFLRTFYNLRAVTRRHEPICIKGLQTGSDFGFTNIFDNRGFTECRKQDIADTTRLNFFIALHSAEEDVNRHTAWRSTG